MNHLIKVCASLKAIDIPGADGSIFRIIFLDNGGDQERGLGRIASGKSPLRHPNKAIGSNGEKHPVFGACISFTLNPLRQYIGLFCIEIINEIQGGGDPCIEDVDRNASHVVHGGGEHLHILHFRRKKRRQGAGLPIGIPAVGIIIAINGIHFQSCAHGCHIRLDPGNLCAGLGFEKVRNRNG